MLLAVISDIHGNLPALEAVVAELEREQPDELVCLGDVALGPQPSETRASPRARMPGCDGELGCLGPGRISGGARRTVETLR